MDDIRRPLLQKKTISPLAAAPKLTVSETPLGLPAIDEPTADKKIHFKPRPWKKWLIIAVAILVVLLAGGAIGLHWWYMNELQPLTTTVSRVRFAVVAGDTADVIGKELQDKGVIRNATAFNWYVRQTNTLNSLRAGVYLFSPTQSVQEIVEWLVEGKVDTFNITILPGKTLPDIKAGLVADGFDATAVDAAFAQTYDHPLLKYKPADVNLDGYIYPETYNITSETTVEQVLTRTFDELYKQIQDHALEPALTAKGFNLHQAITLASIIQMEASKPDDRRQIAQVFEKRLAEGMVIGSDVTYMYAARLLGQPASVNIDSPYNTRKFKGLPPGAIANFTLSSLESVADPASGDYLYFVAGDDGTVHYATTEAEHEQNVRDFCHELCN